jgi:predicted dehydrogenase
MRGKFAFVSPYDPELRTYNPELGGGALLDIGIYPIMDILRYMGEPGSIAASSVLSPTGADESTSVIFKFSDGRMAEAYCSFANMSGVSTELNCEKGNLILSRGRDRNQHLVIELPGDTDDRIFTPPAQGYQYEAMEVMNCLDKGLTESPVVPLSFTLALARTLDAVRKKAGIKYPGRDR